VFVRGNRLNPPQSEGTGVAYDSLTAFNSAADMAASTNGLGSRRMASNNQWGAGLSYSVGGTAPVPETDPAGMGSDLALVGGVLGLLERRRTRA
jgi:hypothetical protein